MLPNPLRQVSSPAIRTQLESRPSPLYSSPEPCPDSGVRVVHFADCIRFMGTANLLSLLWRHLGQNSVSDAALQNVYSAHYTC